MPIPGPGQSKKAGIFHESQFQKEVYTALYILRANLSLGRDTSPSALYTLRILKATPTLQLPQLGTDTTERPASSGSQLRTRCKWEIVLETGETALSRNNEAHSFTK